MIFIVPPKLIGIPLGLNKPTNIIFKITEAVFLAPSTLDYVGICEGHYLDFEAKETINKKGFPMENIASHQITAMENILKHKGITFAIVFLRAFNEIYLIDGQVLIDYYKQSKWHHSLS